MIKDVGPDTYGFSKHKDLINQVWTWTKENIDKLGIKANSL